ncbi:MAG TPA: hypothetical protein EYO42_05375, partial [Candidatus Poseidoniales archaeon]|nr:hypothetical protein [Candidatus Poseidoniales archaeon]
MARERLAIIILILFFAPSVLPLVGGDSGDPDFDVVELTITECETCGGSVDNSDGITLAPGGHTISFKVENVGTLLASCDVKIYHWSNWDSENPSVTRTMVQQVELTPIGAGGTSLSYTLPWSAVTGTTQRISAEIISGLDINDGNDEESFEFEVSSLVDAVVVTDDLPESGERIAKASNTDFHVTVLNTGVMAVMAKFELKIIEADDATAFETFISTSVQILPGTLASPAQGVVLTTTVVPGPTLVGDYIVEPKVLFTGTMDFEESLASINTLSISDYIAELIVPANRAIEPGSSTLASFSIKNTGTKADTYTVTFSDGESWAEANGYPLDVGPVASGGGYGYFDISVAIPAAADRGDSTLVTATVTSQNTEAPFILTGGVTIVAGDEYKGVLGAVTVDDTIFPDVTKQVEFILTNDGNSPTGFSITAGLSSPAENWDIDVLSSSIPTLNPEDIPTLGDSAGTASVLIDVTPPALTNPLDPALKLLAGSTIKMWVMVMPVEGGEPTITTFDFAMQPTITVNPALDHSEILLTEQEVIDGVGAGGFQHVVDLDISVLHNLWTSDHLDNPINAAFTIGTVEFTPKTSGGGVYETGRWSTSVSPTSTSLFPGDTDVGSLSILGPNDQMPLAGTLTIPVVSTPVENSMLAFHSTVTPKEVSHDFIVHIPEVSGVVINQPEPLDVESGSDTILTLDFENTGNDEGSYSLSVGDGIPDDWVVTFDASSGATGTGGTGGTGGTVTTTYAINNLSAEMEAHPLQDGRHQTTFDITVFSHKDTLADTLQEIPIRVLNTETGLYILDYVVTVRIQERVDMIVEAEDDGLVSLSVYETPFTRIKIHNTGNVLTSYHVSLDESEAGGITFSIETPEDMLIAAGFNDSIKLRLVPDPDASADIDHKVTVWVSTDTDLTASAVITASIIADHQLSAVVDPLTYIVPGETAEVTIMLVNSGNLVMNVDPIVTIDDGWTVSIIPTSVTLMTGQSMEFTATVTAPPLDGTDSMQDGDMHTITVVFVDGDLTTRAIGTGTLVVSAIFDLVATEWDETAQFMFLTKHQYSPMLTNTGNTDLLVDLTYEITNPAGQPSVIWEVDGGAPSVISLPRGSAMEISFSVSQWGPDPSINDIAFLKLSIDPQDINVTGSASISSTLVMSRLFTQEVEIEASDLSSTSPISQTVAWSHIPAGGSTAAEYKLEYCGAERTRPAEPDSDDQDWTFEMTAATDTLDMDVDETACTGTRITLPSAAAYEYNSLTFKITTPVWPHIYSGDGWDMTFRLYHPLEHDDYTVYHEAVISFILKNSPELSVSNVKLTLSENRDYLIEGTLDTGSVT